MSNEPCRNTPAVDATKSSDVGAVSAWKAATDLAFLHQHALEYAIRHAGMPIGPARIYASWFCHEYGLAALADASVTHENAVPRFRNLAKRANGGVS